MLYSGVITVYCEYHAEHIIQWENFSASKFKVGGTYIYNML
jgi:hypothetical protein